VKRYTIRSISSTEDGIVVKISGKKVQGSEIKDNCDSGIDLKQRFQVLSLTH
jgi:hypothetical protein